MRKFNTGAVRDDIDGKLDYEGFLCPLCIKKYAEYMHKNRIMKDGSLRASDNWQKGFPPNESLKSLLRHVHDLWLIMRGFPGEARELVDDALSAIIFNAQSILHNGHKKRV